MKVIQGLFVSTKIIFYVWLFTKVSNYTLKFSHWHTVKCLHENWSQGKYCLTVYKAQGSVTWHQKKNKNLRKLHSCIHSCTLNLEKPALMLTHNKEEKLCQKLEQKVSKLCVSVSFECATFPDCTSSVLCFMMSANNLNSCTLHLSAIRIYSKLSGGGKTSSGIKECRLTKV